MVVVVVVVEVDAFELQRAHVVMQQQLNASPVGSLSALFLVKNLTVPRRARSSNFYRARRRNTVPGD